MNIQGDNVLIRAIEDRDLATLHRWANEPEIWYMLGGWHFPSSKNFQEKWFASLADKTLNQHFVIEAPEVGLIGTANLVDIDWKNRRAFHGMMLGEKEIRGKGYGADTVRAIMRYAFEELGLQRIDGSMIEYNTSSLKMYIDKCGWKEEGRQRNWYFRKNRYWDRILVGVTRDDYFQMLDKKRASKTQKPGK